MTTYKSPSVPLLSDPVGLDLEIQLIQQTLSENLTWLTNVYGRARQGQKKQTGEPNYLYPMVYIGNRNYYDASPNDNLTSQSFFIVETQPYTVTNGYDVGEHNKYTAEVALIVWGNLNKVNSLIANPYPDEHFGHILLQDTLSALRKTRNFKVSRILEDERGIFDMFGVRSSNHKLFYHPYFCFKITGDVAFEDECDEAINDRLYNQSI